jgi:hypothetical protein
MSCPRGKIRRSSYKKKDGTSVKSTCVPDKGKKGKTPERLKVLPKFSGKLHLSQYGYSTEKLARDRRSSLKRASKKEGDLPVLRHLVLARNYSKSNKPVYQIMNKDIKYLSREYKKTKKNSKKKSKKN